MTYLDDAMIFIVFTTFAVGLFYFIKIAIFEEKDTKK